MANCSILKQDGKTIALSETGAISQIFPIIQESVGNDDKAVEIYQDLLNEVKQTLGNGNYPVDIAGEPVLDYIKDWVTIPFAYEKSNENDKKIVAPVSESKTTITPFIPKNKDRVITKEDLKDVTLKPKDKVKELLKEFGVKGSPNQINKFRYNEVLKIVSAYNKVGQALGAKLMSLEKAPNGNYYLRTYAEIDALFDKYKNVEDALPSKNTTVSETLEHIASSKSPLAPLAKHLQQFADINDVKITVADTLFLSGEGSATKVPLAGGGYFSTENRIELASILDKKTPESTVLHEILHALTREKLKDNSEETQQFKQIFEYAKANMPDSYALSDVDEFIVALFTDSKFITEMSKTKASDTVTHKNLLEEVFDYLLNLLNITKSEEPTLYEQAYVVATNILEKARQEKENKNRATESIPTSFYEQMEQDISFLASNVDSFSNLSPKQKLEFTQNNSVLNQNGRYFYKGKEVSKRVSEVTTKPYYAKVFANTEKNFDEGSLEQAQVGTIIHAYNEFIFDNIIKGIPNDYETLKKQVKDQLSERVNPETGEAEFKNLPDKLYSIKPFFDTLVTGLTNLHKDIEEKAKYRGGVTYFLEPKIYSEKEDVMGSVDLLAVFGDGTASIYDYKNIFFKYERVLNPITGKKETVFPEDTKIAGYKKIGYDLQIGKYKDILEKEYGLKIRESRVIPLAVAVNKKGIVKVQMNHLSNLEYLRQLPVAGESSTNKDFNKAILILRKRKTALEEKFKFYADDADEIQAQIEEIEIAINDALIEKSTIPLLENTIKVLERLENGLQAEELNIEEINQGVKHIKAIKGITQLVKGDDTIENLRGIAIKKIDDYLQDARDALISYYKDKTGENLDDIVREGDLSLTFTERRSNISPIIQAQNQYLDTAKDSTYNEIKTLSEELTEWKKRIEAETSLASFYNGLIDYDSRNLIEEFNEELKTSTRQAFTKGETGFLKDYYRIAPFWRGEYSKKKKNYEKWLDKTGATAELKEKKLISWVAKNDLSKDSAWKNSKNRVYLVPNAKAVTKFTSSKYKSLSKLQKEFHTYYTSKNKEFARKLDRDFNNSFVASIQSTFVDNLVDSKDINEVLKAAGRYPANFLDSITAEQEVDGFNSEDKVPIYYMRQTADFKSKQIVRDGLSALQNDKIPSVEFFQILNLPPTNPVKDTIEVANNFVNRLTLEEKSTDLLSSMLLFGGMVSNYEYMNGIKANVETLRFILENQPQYLTDSIGRIKIDIDGSFLTGQGNTKYLEYFDTMTNYYVYGRKLQSKDMIFKAFGRNLSALKIFTKAHSYLSEKALVGNVKSATAGGIAASLNVWFYAQKGQYFNKEQFAKSNKLLAKNPIRTFKALEYFNINDDGWNFREADKLKSHWIKRNITGANKYILQRITESHSVNLSILSLLQNYGLDSNEGLKKNRLLTRRQ
jgi:hypothetical protein